MFVHSMVVALAMSGASAARLRRLRVVALLETPKNDIQLRKAAVKRQRKFLPGQGGIASDKWLDQLDEPLELGLLLIFLLRIREQVPLLAREVEILQGTPIARNGIGEKVKAML